MDDDRLDRFVDTARRAADEAGRIIRPCFRAASLRAETKSDLSPVTEADRAAEQAIRAVIEAAHPTHALIGEETADKDGDAFRAATFCWVIDPIDGTRAFITGRPTFGTLIALLHEGRPLIGLIDQPVTGERWLGVRGRPTRFTGPFGGRVGTRACTDLAAAELSATSPSMFDANTRPRFDRLAACVARTSWGGDCYAYGLLALGQLDVVAEAAMKLWDWAALVPVVEGAGGVVTDWDGRPLTIGDRGSDARADVEVLACAHPALADSARICLARAVPLPASPPT